MTATTIYISALARGFMKAKMISVFNCVLISSSFAFPKRIFSYISRTHALMIRMPDTSSCIIALIASSCVCNLENRGPAFSRQTAITLTRKGKAHNTINPKRIFNRNIKYILPKVSIEVLISPRTNVETKFCT